MNIILAGVGGQGLVMTTQIICEVASRAGADVKSNDVVGLSQRGGKVWGSVKYGKVIHSPNIEKGTADILMALEPLEGLRWQSFLKAEGQVLLNCSEIYPVFAIAEKQPYPHDYKTRFRADLHLKAHDALKSCEALGSSKMVNVFLLGMLAKCLDFEPDLWKEVISDHVPSKLVDLNLQAFDQGYLI